MYYSRLYMYSKNVKMCQFNHLFPVYFKSFFFFSGFLVFVREQLRLLSSFRLSLCTAKTDDIQPSRTRDPPNKITEQHRFGIRVSNNNSTPVLHL